MTGPTHAIVGLASVVLIARTTGYAPNALGLLFALLGSLGPDIDSDTGSISKPGRLFSRFLPFRAARVLDEIGQTICGVARTISGHRGMFHWPIWGLLLIGLGLYLGKLWLFWFGIGYLSHILADACTSYGVPMFGPFSLTPKSLAPIRTGSVTELGLTVCLTIAVAVFGWRLLPEKTRAGFDSLYNYVAADR